MARTSVVVSSSIPSGVQDHLVETYTIVATGGTFDLGLATLIAFGANEAAIQAELDGSYTPGDYIVNGGAPVFTVRHPFAAAGQTPLAIVGDNLTGPSAAATQETTYDQAGERLHVTDGAKFLNNGEVRVLIKSIGAAHDVTFVATKQVGPQSLDMDDLTFHVEEDADFLAGPFPVDQFNQPPGADVGAIFVNTDGTGTDVYIIPYKDS